MTLASVIVVEDERFTRTMLATALGALGIDVVGVCASAAQALALQAEHDVDVAVLDLDLGPGPSGIDIAYALREQRRDVGLVFLTSFSDPRIHDPSARPLPRGARFVVKSQLADAAVLRGIVLDTAHDPLRATGRQDALHGLTARQVDVVRQVAAGRTNAEIATASGVTEKAVERMLARIYDVLGVDRTAGNARVLLARAYADLSGKSMPSA